MLKCPRRPTALLTLTAVLAGLLPVLAPAAASATRTKTGAGRCTTPHGARIPYLTAPCDGATVAARQAVLFTVHDSDPKATLHAPYLNLQTTRQITGGHLAPNRNGNGIFAQMSAVPGHAGEWSYTSARQTFPSWWDNRVGTDYVQVEQVDPRVTSGVVYGPITTVRVAAAGS